MGFAYAISPVNRKTYDVNGPNLITKDVASYKPKLNISVSLISVYFELRCLFNAYHFCLNWIRYLSSVIFPKNVNEK